MSEIKDVLIVEGLEAWYGEAHILHGLDFVVRQGECVALLGRNGAGRTTALRAVMGMIPKRTGSVRINGTETITSSPDKIAYLGVGYCPEERGIFASLTCEENLYLPKTIGSLGMSETEIYDLFPSLKERAKGSGGKLSGGEQQMLAIGRILHAGAPILLLDEISEGLSPVILQTLKKVILELKKRHYTILLVEQNLRFAAPLADRMYVIELGRAIKEMNQQELHDNMDAVEALLGV